MEQGKVILKSAPAEQYSTQQLAQIHGCPFVVTELRPQPDGRVQVLGKRVSL
jgi:ABC-type hemin transport system ATPase subunit